MARTGTMLITGGTRGIGAAIARRMLRRGWRVFVTSRTDAAPPEGAERLPLEITDDASVAACVAEAQARAGAIDVLVNNSGYDLYAPFETTPAAAFDDQMAVNFTGAVRMTQAVLPGMRARRAGRIVQIASLGGLQGLPFNTAYAASKFAMLGFSQALRLELLPLGLWVSAVIPGTVATDTLDRSIRDIGPAEGPYAVRFQRMVAQMRRAGAASPTRPDDVARVVERASTVPAPRFAYFVGRQAWLLGRLKALTPEALFERALRGRFG
jgi:NAD(P)-dependent dehydrogenase (short-subunit alcohol dehydrogenase family)